MIDNGIWQKIFTLRFTQHYDQNYDDQRKLKVSQNGKRLACVWPTEFIQEYFILFDCHLLHFNWLLLQLYFARIWLHFRWSSSHLNVLWKHWVAFSLDIITFECILDASSCIFIGYHYIWMYFGCIGLHFHWFDCIWILNWTQLGRNYQGRAHGLHPLKPNILSKVLIITADANIINMNKDMCWYGAVLKNLWGCSWWCWSFHLSWWSWRSRWWWLSWWSWWRWKGGEWDGQCGRRIKGSTPLWSLLQHFCHLNVLSVVLVSLLFWSLLQPFLSSKCSVCGFVLFLSWSLLQHFCHPNVFSVVLFCFFLDPCYNIFVI